MSKPPYGPITPAIPAPNYRPNTIGLGEYKNIDLIKELKNRGVNMSVERLSNDVKLDPDRLTDDEVRSNLEYALQRQKAADRDVELFYDQYVKRFREVSPECGEVEPEE